MEFDPNLLDSEQLEILRQSKENPGVWAENFLVDPDTRTPYQANFPQWEIFNSKAKYTWFAIHRRAGKCLAGDTLVLHPQTLRPTRLEDLHKIQTAFVFDFTTNRLVPSEALWIKSEPKQCVKLYLGSGTSITLSVDHLIFGWRQGWIPAENLQIGDRILGPSEIPLFGTVEPTDDELIEAIDYVIQYSDLPNAVFLYTKSGLAVFLARLWEATGRLLNSNRRAMFLLKTPKMAQDVRHLLLRFGVDSRIESDGDLFVEEAIDLSVFLNIVGVKVPILDVHGPRRWDIVIGIRRVGLRDVYDLSVEHPDHNFLANDIIVHNSYALSILALWHAMMVGQVIGKKIAIWAISSDQIRELFQKIDRWVESSPVLAEMKSSPWKDDPYTRTFATGAMIEGHILGAASHLERSRRGITPDVNIVDEAQELSKEQFHVVGPMMAGDRYRAHRVRNYLAGTINEPVGRFYEMTYRKKQFREDIHKVILIPIDENKDFTPEEVEAKRLEVDNEEEWQKEWLIRPSETSKSVFKKADLDKCSISDWQYGEHMVLPQLPRIITIDWDSEKAGSNIMVGQYNYMTGRVTIIYRYEVPRMEFHYIHACEAVLKIAEVYNPTLILADQGGGMMQCQVLQNEAQKRPDLKLQGKIIPVSFSERVAVPGVDKPEPIKPFMVGLLNKKLQDESFLIPSHDQQLYGQLLMYKEVRRTENTTIYTRENEHLVDTSMLMCYAIWMLFENGRDGQSASAQPIVVNPVDEVGRTMGTDYVPYIQAVDSNRGAFSDQTYFRTPLEGYQDWGD